MPRTPPTTQGSSSSPSATTKARNAIRARAFSDAAALVTPIASVVITGPISRTWYVDRAVAQDIMEWLHSCGVIPLVIGVKTFRDTIEKGVEYVQGAGAGYLEDHAEGVASAIRCATLCIVLVGRVDPVIASASEAAACAVDEGVPILALHPDGHAEFIG